MRLEALRAGRRLAWIGGLVSAAGVSGQDQPLPLTPLPSIPDFTDGSGWGVALGVGAEYGNAYDGADEEEFESGKDFGLSAADAEATGLEERQLESGYRSIGVTAVYRRDLTSTRQVIAETGFELYSSEVQKGPIAREDLEAEAGGAVVWRC